jgi:hypothetical protein
LQKALREEFRDRVRTEEVKAWYSEPEDDSLFQGTSVSSLTIPHIVQEPLEPVSMVDLEEIIADAYIHYHNENVDAVKGAIQENTDEWISQGLYYGVVLSSKLVSQALGLSIESEEVIFDIGGCTVDPHEITSYPTEVREEYFGKCRETVECFNGLELERKELEASLALADISKPKILKYKDKIMLAPIRCNEIATLVSKGVVEKIIEKTSGRIRPKSMTVVIYDTDTPYTYHEIMGFTNRALSPALPGLVVLGSSGTIEAFRWLYTYRVSLITQKIQKGSLFSQVKKSFIPFVFFGVLVWRDAEILLDMNNLSMLRYRGNLAPDLEFAYLTPTLYKRASCSEINLSWDSFEKKHFV